MSWKTLKTSIGNLPVWECLPKNPAHSGVVVLHEAFRVTEHLKRMTQWLADNGYHAIAPDLLFRVAQPEQPLPVNKIGLDAARDLIGKTPPEQSLADMRTCVDYLRAQGCAKVGLIGYCYGGSLSYAGGTGLEVEAVDSYYGGQLWELAAKGQPTAPTQVHLAKLDRYIPLDATLEAFAKNHPSAKVYVYDADHGFNRDDGVSYDKIASDLARARTLDFFAKNLK